MHKESYKAVNFNGLVGYVECGARKMGSVEIVHFPHSTFSTYSTEPLDILKMGKAVIECYCRQGTCALRFP